MKADTLKSDVLLVLTAAIWGLAFVAQRLGMEHLGPFTFNALRFSLGCASLIPLMIIGRHPDHTGDSLTGLVKAGLVCGFFLFAGASLQQVGIVYTTAGKAGFITGLYVILVPFLNMFFKQEKTTPGAWIGAFLAVIGMFLLSVTENLTMEFGDILVLLCAFGFAGHLLVVGRYTRRFSSLNLCFAQFTVCAILSFVAAAFTETAGPEDIVAAGIPLLYGGVMSVGVAYSLQVYAQKRTLASHAAIILSLESVFAAVGGFLILGERLSGRGLVGCGFILAGILISQVYKGGSSSGA